MTCIGDYMCRKRVTDLWYKLTVGDVYRTLCKQKQASAFYVRRIVTEIRQNGFLGLHFTANYCTQEDHATFPKINAVQFNTAQKYLSVLKREE